MDTTDLKEVGRGNYAKVYLVKPEVIKKQIASSKERDFDYCAFAREFILSKKAEEIGVGPKIYELSFDSDPPYMTEERLYPLEYDDFSTPDFIEKVLLLLYELFQNEKTRILHIDPKPDNFMKTATGELRLIDYGVCLTLTKFRNHPLSHIYSLTMFGAYYIQHLSKYENNLKDVFKILDLWNKKWNHVDHPLSKMINTMMGFDDLSTLYIYMNAIMLWTQQIVFYVMHMLEVCSYTLTGCTEKRTLFFDEYSGMSYYLNVIHKNGTNGIKRRKVVGIDKTIKEEDAPLILEENIWLDIYTDVLAKLESYKVGKVR